MARTGDEIDDYCPRCRRLTNHTIAAMVGETVVSATCRTCGFQHEYRGGTLPARTAKPKASAFDQVLAGILGGQDATAGTKPPASGRGRSRKTPGRRQSS